jgi:hypothetical protein
LLELADERALYTAASDRAARALSAFRARAARAHEAVSGLREAGGSPLRNQEVARAVDGFGAVLAELGDVLLVLDTCEELAKADMGNPAAPAVRATLDIIERLHERAPSVRVLLAGRRPLPARPYLTVQPVAGFTADEARAYLASSAGRPLPADLALEMVRQSPAVDGPVPAAGELPGRVSPFDLALYAAWADEDPDLDVTQVSRGSDAYVEGRIIERLDDPLVVRALPALAAAGRCRITAIAGLLDCDPAVLGRRLAEQEWVDADGDPPTHVAAKPALARRLRRYFEAGERHAEYAARTTALASGLLARAAAAPLAEVDADELIAALRLAAPADAAALWESVAARATEPPGRWGTVLNLTRRVLGEWDEEEWPTTPALRATVTAAHIAASRRDSPLFDPRGAWQTVLTWADWHPRWDTQRTLDTRAALGLVADPPPGNDLLDQLRQDWLIAFGTEVLNADRPQWDALGAKPLFSNDDAPAVTAAALLDALDRLLEAGDRRWRVDPAPRAEAPGTLPAPLPLSRLVSSLALPDTRALEAWAMVIRARLLADSDQAAARDALGDAERLAAAITDPEPSWPDWVPPDDLLARVRIERGLIAPPDDLAVLDEWEAYAADHIDTIDGERLASLCLQIRLRHGPVDAATAERWEAADGYVPDRVPVCTAHDLVPPLCVSVAHAWLSAGRPERALALLDQRRGEALATRADELTVRRADAETVAIVRRLRLTDRQSLLTRLAAGESPPPGPGSVTDTARGMAWRALSVAGVAIVSGQAPVLADADSWHAWWQSQLPAPPLLAELGLADRLLPQAWPPARGSAEIADIRADLEEIRQLRSPGDARAVESALAEWLGRPTPPTPARGAEPHRELRAAMRTAALAGEDFAPPAGMPPRLLGEMAFEEAELTALRLPAAAARLLLVAARAYQEAGDALGELLCCLSAFRNDSSASGPSSPSLASPSLEETRRRAAAAVTALRSRAPAAAAALAGQPEEAGLWRYWAQAVQELASPLSQVRVQAVELPGTSAAADPDIPSPGLGSIPETSSPAPGTAGTPVLVPPGSAPGGTASSAPRRTRPGLRAVVAALVAVALIGLGLVGASVVLLPGASHRPVGTPTTSAQATSGGTAASTASPTVTRSSGPTSTAATPPPASPTASPAASGGAVSQAAWIAALIAGLVIIVALASWGLLRLGRPADRANAPGRGSPLFVMTVDPVTDREFVIRLSVGPRSRRTAPPRARPVRWLTESLRRLIRPLRRGTAEYEGVFRSIGDRPGWDGLSWSGPRPDAGTRWWRRWQGTALGAICVPLQPFAVSATRPNDVHWERVMTGSLSPAAAGRIEWIRFITVPSSGDRLGWPVDTAVLSPDELRDVAVAGRGRIPDSRSFHRPASAVLAAPSAWDRALRQYYTPTGDSGASIGLRHVIGRAVATAAGPVMQVTDEAAVTGPPVTPPGAEPFLGMLQLKRQQPDIVILQAEPAPLYEKGTEPPEDQAEKLRLAAGLIEEGVSVVILLPVLPAAVVEDLAQVISEHAGRWGDTAAQLLLTRLRQVIAPHVPPPVLDDVVLFLNAAEYRRS